MDLQNLRTQLAAAIETSSGSQYIFAQKHGFSYSTLNKFLKGHLINPRLSTIRQYERAIEHSSTLHNSTFPGDGTSRRRPG